MFVVVVVVVVVVHRGFVLFVSLYVCMNDCLCVFFSFVFCLLDWLLLLLFLMAVYFVFLVVVNNRLT